MTRATCTARAALTMMCACACLPAWSQPVEERREWLLQAEARLRAAADFSRADPAPLISLGDALAAQGELAAAQGAGEGVMRAGAQRRWDGFLRVWKQAGGGCVAS